MKKNGRLLSQLQNLAWIKIRAFTHWIRPVCNLPILNRICQFANGSNRWQNHRILIPKRVLQLALLSKSYLFVKTLCTRQFFVSDGKRVKAGSIRPTKDIAEGAIAEEGRRSGKDAAALRGEKLSCTKVKTIDFFNQNGFRKTFIGCSTFFLTVCVNAGEFSMWGEYLHFRRMLSHEQSLVNERLCTPCVFYNINDAKHVVSHFKFEPGYRVGAAYMTRHTTWEATYLWMHEWQHRSGDTRSNRLFFSSQNPSLLHDYAYADHVVVRYKSNFENGEVNYYRNVTPRKENYISCSWLLGLRYIHLWEDLNLAYTKGGNTSDYKVETKNHLGALQIGGVLEWMPTKHLSWDFIAKIGLGCNWAKERVYVRDYNNTVVVHDFEASGYAFPPFVADGTVTLGYQFFKYLNGHVGYQLIYVSGIAVASDQVQKGEEYRHHVKITGEALIYGVFGGLTVSF